MALSFERAMSCTAHLRIVSRNDSGTMCLCPFTVIMLERFPLRCRMSNLSLFVRYCEQVA